LKEEPTATMRSQTAGKRALTAAAMALVALVLAHAFGGPGPAPAQAQAPADERPNIVLIESDDQDLASMRFMPETNRLIGDRGATFPSNFATWPLCCPSRATLFTGQYPHNHGVLGNKGAPLGGFDRLKLNTAMPVWLSNAGYYTAHIGKFLNGYEESGVGVPPGWTEWHGSKDTYRYYGYDLLENGQWVEYGDQSEDPDSPARPETYSTDVYTDKAVNLIGQRAPSAQPFFLSLAYLAPHGGTPHERADGSPSACVNTAKPAIRHFGDLAGEPLPQPPNFNESNVTDKPTAIRELGLMGSRSIARATKNFRCRMESILGIDEGVKRIIGALRNSGELDNTIVIYTSDNGFFHGEHRIVSGKNRVYEEAVKVPLLMRGPGIPKGVTVKELAGNIDLAPTIADAAEASPLLKVDGRSLLPMAEHPDRYLGREMLLEQYSGVAEPGEPTGGVYVAVRTQHYKYVENTTGEVELYDIIDDPYELKNQHLNPKFTEIEAALRRRLNGGLADCAGSECRAKPQMAFRIRAERQRGKSCYKAGSFSVRLKPRGINETPIAQATFRVGEKTIAVLDEKPFEIELPTKPLRAEHKPEIAVDVELLDGRIRTLHDQYKVCS